MRCRLDAELLFPDVHVVVALQVCDGWVVIVYEVVCGGERVYCVLPDNCA